MKKTFKKPTTGKPRGKANSDLTNVEFKEGFFRNMTLGVSKTGSKYMQLGFKAGEEWVNVSMFPRESEASQKYVENQLRMSGVTAPFQEIMDAFPADPGSKVRYVAGEEVACVDPLPRVGICLGLSEYDIKKGETKPQGKRVFIPVKNNGGETTYTEEADDDCGF